MSASAQAEHRILVVEDDDDVREASCAVLADEGYAVSQCRNGLEALDYLRANRRPDLIVLDLVMPTMNGWEFRVRQKGDPTIASIPVLAVSADASDKAAAIDADAYLKKPFSSDVFIETIGRIVTGGASSWLRSQIARTWESGVAGAFDEGVRRQQRVRGRPVRGDAVAGGGDPVELASLRALRGAVVGVVNGSQLGEALRCVVEEACGLTGACCGALRVFDVAGAPFADVVCRGVCDALHVCDDGARPEGVPGQATLMWRGAGEAGQPVPATFIDALQQNRTKTGALLTGPLHDGDDLLGNLYLADKAGVGGFTAEDARLFEGFCGHAALVLRMWRHLGALVRDCDRMKADLDFCRQSFKCRD